MATNCPIGWQTSRMNMHFKTVTPVVKDDTGMYFNLYKNMRKELLPREVREDPNTNVEAARRILYRHRLIHRAQRPPREKLRSIVRKSSNENTYQSEPSIRPSTSPEAHLGHYRKLYLPPVNKSLPATPGSRYTARDIRGIVERLSTYDPVKIPESRGYVVKLPTPIVYKKKYTDDEVKNIVERLSEYDPDRHPPESKGIPVIVPRLARQTMRPPPKCTSDEVQDVVERLCAVHFDPPSTRGTMRGTTRGTTGYEPTPVPVTR
ncbi:hypothetical protein FSP39_016069 [Pinctada imbricata]|uniref:Uncharacterized protein n=1 Tax=Pinctada imbricata TaxID=66713 RepID=A0AA89BME4_PINIB|nr:hypothetical protein FSP39_016069 [Pinctada imbricata]